MKTAQTLLFFLFSLSIMAQTSPFKAGAAVGVNFTQVDGDKEFGYQKKGLTLGLRGGIVFNQRWEVLTELLYNFKGAEPSREEKKLNKRLIDIDLHYAEIPVLIKFSFGQSEGGYYKWDVFGGISYGRLLRSNVLIQKNDLSVDSTESKTVNQLGFKTSDLSVVIGASYHFNAHFGMSIRHTVSMTPFYKNPNPTAATNLIPASYESFRNYFLSVNLFYDFIAPKLIFKKKKETPQ